MTENPSREVATKDHSNSNPPKGNPPDLKAKVDVSKVDVNQKNPRAHKNKIGAPPLPPPKPKIPPLPLKRGILWTWFFLQKERIFPGVHKIDAPISGPRIADTNFTDTRILLS